MAADREFEEAVERWIVGALPSCGGAFGSLVRALPGVDPLQVRAALERLIRADGAHAGEAAGLLASAAAATPTYRKTSERPVPHPLEFYWRSDDTSLELFCQLLRTHPPQSTIAYLGMPNAFQVAREALPDRRHVVIDRSIRRMDSLGAGSEAIRLDVLRDMPPPLGADVVVTDPPWYPEHLRSFLWVAARLLNVGGTIYASLPPDGTRPTVGRERDDLFTWARTAGLELVEYRAAALRYVSSPFELASHRAAGLGGIPLDWRCGDLAALRLAGRRDVGRPALAHDEGQWLAYTVGDIPIWVRDRADASGPVGAGLLASVVGGDVLTTVSRRDPLRANVDVWTSLNRVFRTSHPAALQAVCLALGDDCDPIAAVTSELDRGLSDAERVAVVNTADRLAKIVTEEREMHGLNR